MSYLKIPFPNFLCPKQTVVQKGGIAALRFLPATRVAVIVSKRLEEYSPLKAVIEKSKRSQFLMIHPSWEGEPSIKGLQGSLCELEMFKPDYIVAIGGGSIIDGAKILWALYEHPHFPISKLSIPFSLPPLRCRAQFAAIPTTAGTGSEASSSAIVLDAESERKIPIVTHDFLPDLVILDPDLLEGISPQLFGISALDAISHSIEGYLSIVSNPLAENLVVPALHNLILGIDGYQKNMKSLAYEQCLIGAYYAGLIQNMLLVGPAHAIAHQLGRTGIPHGLATGLLLPKVIRHYSSVSTNLRGKYERLFKGLECDSLEGFLYWLEALPVKFHLPTHFSQWPKAQAPTVNVGELANADSISRFFPEPISSEVLNDIFGSAWK